MVGAQGVTKTEVVQVSATVGSATIGQAGGFGSLDQLTDFIVQHAPQKQLDRQTFTANAEIGRTPGAACESARYLANLVERGRASEAAKRKLTELLDWIVQLQAKDSGKPWNGGVPSTPDLPGAGSSYYYAIDAALCGEAVFRAHAVLGTPALLESGIGFAEFLLKMQTGPGLPRDRGGNRGFCEFVVRGSAPAWNCASYTKLLIGLVVLKHAYEATGRQEFQAAAVSARNFLLPGMAGAWEFADACKGAELLQTVLASDQRVRTTRRTTSSMVTHWPMACAVCSFTKARRRPFAHSMRIIRRIRAAGPKTAAYDPTLGFAGYLVPSQKTADEFSAYYDLVTVGILNEVKRAVAPDDFRQIDCAAAKSWIGSGGSELAAGDGSVHSPDPLHRHHDDRQCRRCLAGGGMT